MESSRAVISGLFESLRNHLRWLTPPQRPVILWDIDGPLNPFGASGLGSDPRFQPLTGDWNSGLFNLVDHPTWARELSVLPVDFLWVSNWGDESNVAKAALGLLENIPHVPLEPGSGATLKLDSVRAWLKSHGEPPVVWVDDEFHEDAFQWAEERGVALLVKVDPAVGWTREQQLAMMVWLREHIS